MDQSDIVVMLDRKYAGQSQACPNEGREVQIGRTTISNHGNMTVHGSGSFLICGVCGAKAPTATN